MVLPIGRGVTKVSSNEGALLEIDKMVFTLPPYSSDYRVKIGKVKRQRGALRDARAFVCSAISL